MTEANNDWVMNKAKRAAFWATANDLELSEEETREALGLGPDENGDYASTKLYSGTLDEAMDAIALYADRKRTQVEPEDIPEAPIIIYSQGKTPEGWEVSFTARGRTARGTAAQFKSVIMEMNLSPLFNGRYQEPVKTIKAARESSSPPPPPSPSGETGGQGESEYTNVEWGGVKSITVNADGQVQIDAANRKYPLKDSRGADVVAGLFTDDCWTQDWAPTHLSQPGVYQPQGLQVKSGKNSRGYWDAIEIRRA